MTKGVALNFLVACLLFAVTLPTVSIRNIHKGREIKFIENFPGKTPSHILFELKFAIHFCWWRASYACALHEKEAKKYTYFDIMAAGYVYLSFTSSV